MLEYILIGIILAQFGYMILKDFLHREQLEKLQLKFMSKNVHEYMEVAKSPKKETQKTQTTSTSNMELDDVPVDKLIEAKDNL